MRRTPLRLRLVGLLSATSDVVERAMLRKNRRSQNSRKDNWDLRDLSNRPNMLRPSHVTLLSWKQRPATRTRDNEKQERAVEALGILVECTHTAVKDQPYRLFYYSSSPSLIPLSPCIQSALLERVCRVSWRPTSFPMKALPTTRYAVLQKEWNEETTVSLKHTQPIFVMMHCMIVD